ncbi:LuxR C-terminal-related transcriptional regulator [Streptomyces sp. NPDC126514]|uniref:LuxR C-terminal-related transcriptional regulator n=1 Tax=Streptomyces sp. NPDC126514 TaxID=3155210 RepID=UPI003327515F
MPLPVPDTLVATVRQTLAALPDTSRSLVHALAVLRTRQPLALAAVVAGIGDAAQALGPLVNTTLVDWNPSEPTTPVWITHQLQRDAVYETLSPTRRRELHMAAVAVVDTDTAWAHRVAAAERADPELADALEAEAARKTAAGYTARASALLRWAADLSDSRPAYERRLLRAVSFFGTGTLAVARSLKPQIDQCAPCAFHTGLQSAYAYLNGDLIGATSLAEHALAEAGAEGDPATLAEARARLGLWYLLRGLPQQAADILRPAMHDAPASPADMPTAMTQWLFSQTFLSAEEPARLLQQPWITALPANPAHVDDMSTLALLSRGYALIVTGQLSAARDDLDAVLDPVRTHRTLSLARVHAHFNLACCNYLLGDWDRAAIGAEHAGIEGDIGNYLIHHVPSHSWAAIIAAGRGHFDTAQHHLDTLTSHPYIPIHADLPALAQAVIAQARNDPAGMLRALQPLHDTYISRPGILLLPNLQFWPMYIEALTGTGNLGPAQEAHTRLKHLAVQVPGLHTITAFTSGRLAEAQGHLDTALSAYHAVLDQPPGPDDPPLHRARLEHAAAQLSLATGQRASAARFLQQAHARFIRLGAAPFAARTAADLAGTPVAATTRAAPGAGLTEREDSIARLATHGLTNREIGRELYISSKTVEYHLGHVYQKLGITSRRQLRTHSRLA